MFFGQGLSLGGVRGGAEFTMDFVLVDVGQELVEQTVGPFEFADVIGGQQWGQAFLPVVMAALRLRPRRALSSAEVTNEFTDQQSDHNPSKA
jgi:hypothetical protein